MLRRVLLIAALCLVPALAQAQLVPPIQLQFFNAAGTSPAANGFLCTTQSGGTVSQLTYQDQALTTANANPILLNAAGRPSSGGNEVAVFLQQLNYRFTLYAAGTGNTCNGTTVGALLRQVDGVNGVLVTGSAQIANLGLGAAADGTARLLVSQASNTTAVILTNSSVSKSWNLYNITNGSNTDLRFQESNGSADRVTLQAGGNVGVGTTSPTETLHVSGTGRFTRIGLGGAADASATITVGGNKVINATGALSLDSTGPHALGGGTASNVQLFLTGTFTPTGGSGVGIDMGSTIAGQAGVSSYGLYVNPTLNKAGSGTHPVLAGGSVLAAFGAGAATVTDAIGWEIQTFAAPASTTNASGLRTAAPSGATNNYAINITSGVLKYAQSTVAGLPSCSASYQGAVEAVTDANATTFNSTVAGGGANYVLVLCNGTNWTIH
jgi:hypothetical protein